MLLWARMIFQLRRRSAGRRESGAFLLGPARDASARVATFLCYDDLDANACQLGGITFHAEGYARLWEYCREKKLQIVADVHTHPGKSVRQSPIDQRNPMVPVVGHTALIVPSFGHTSPWSMNGVAVYEYLGDFKWRTHDRSLARRRIVLTVW